MRICVFGAGAVGGHFATRLAAAGHDVSVVCRGAHLEAIRARGLVLRSGDDEIRATVRASDQPDDLGRQEMVLCTVKTTALEGVAETIAPLLGPTTPVIFGQNGIPWWYADGLQPSRPTPPDIGRFLPSEALGRAVGLERVIGAVVSTGNEAVEPGVIVNTSPGRNALTIGEPDDSDSRRIGELRALLSGAGIASPPVGDIRAAIWRKLLVNMTISIISLLTGRRTSVFREDERIAASFLHLSGEAMAIARASGIDLGDYDPEAVRQGAGDHLPSIRQDYERGRPLELASNLLAPLAFGEAAGVETPCLDLLAALAVQKEAERR